MAGFAKISRVVSAFYDKILESRRTNPYFAGVDMRRLIDHQTKFIASIMGGPASYTNDQLERLDSHLAVSERSFSELAALLRETSIVWIGNAASTADAHILPILAEL